MLDLEQLLRVPHVDQYGGFDVSPDGTRLAFAWNRSGQWEIYEVPLDGSAPPRQLTEGPGAKVAPRYAPDGRYLAYVLDLDGGEAYDLYLCDLTGTHTCLTPNSPEALQPQVAWAPAGDQIAILSELAGSFDPYLLPLTGGPARCLWTSPRPAWDVDWSPDGQWLAVVAETSGQDSGTFLLPAAPGGHGEARSIGSFHAREARWAPGDGPLRLAFSGDVRGVFDLGLYTLDTGHVEWLTAGEGDDQAPAWSPDGRYLAYVTGRGPQSWISVLELATGQVRTHQVEPGVHHSPRFVGAPRSAAGGLVAVFENPRHPADFWCLSLADGTWRQLTGSLPAGLQGAPWAMPQTVQYPGLDGRPVPALLCRPAGLAGPSPAVVLVHGGPNWLAQVTWDPFIQHLAGRGWTVLAPNYRGSTGYGRDWQLANRFDLGGEDNRDVVAGARYLVETGLADPRRIAVTGRSYGGYLTMTALTSHPALWAGGSAVVPFVNWFTSHANVRQDVRHWDEENFGDPERDRDLWRDRSPFFFLDRVQAPVQMICGAHDVRCPAAESILARDTLLALGKEVELLLYPDEGHAFLRVENILDAETRRAAFLARVLERGREET